MLAVYKKPLIRICCIENENIVKILPDLRLKSYYRAIFAYCRKTWSAVFDKLKAKIWMALIYIIYPAYQAWP